MYYCVSYLLSWLMLCDKQALRSNMSIIHASGGWLGDFADLDWTQPHNQGYPVVLMDKCGSVPCIPSSNRLSQACVHSSCGEGKNAETCKWFFFFKLRLALCLLKSHLSKKVTWLGQSHSWEGGLFKVPWWGHGYREGKNTEAVNAIQLP